MNTFAVVTGGGTAGHVLPAIAIAEALVLAGHAPQSIHYVGALRGIETRLLPPTAFSHTFYNVVGFQRTLTPANLSFLPKLLVARRYAIRQFREIRPKVVVSVGGYASMPAVLAARRLKIPIVVVSYDRLPGAASRFAARRAAACGVAFPDTTLPRSTFTGAPLRQQILDVDRVRDRASARAALGLPDDRFVVAVMGGSQGSGVLNNAVAAMLENSRADKGLAIRHAVGERFLSDAGEPSDGLSGLLYQPVGFEDRMHLVYAAADVIVGRGGASTVHEVASTGTPAVLVPWAESADDHQTLNVEWLASAGAAIHLPEHGLGELGSVLTRLRENPDELEHLSDKALGLGASHRTGALARLVESVALT